MLDTFYKVFRFISILDTSRYVYIELDIEIILKSRCFDKSTVNWSIDLYEHDYQLVNLLLTIYSLKERMSERVIFSIQLYTYISIFKDDGEETFSKTNKL